MHLSQHNHRHHNSFSYLHHFLNDNKNHYSILINILFINDKYKSLAD